ncbi:heat shock protein transcriptional repressor HspR [Propioniciclava soli]|uniref:MerR family transcriptional regulator n=1 Tax=Propioniciclava soli TaxID=2775081 RepID=A0ABZ3C8E2_9ACTN|nr:MerR family transcriptional regulator [Propioniciclava soli]
MTEHLPATMDVDAPVFTVTVAARLADMHPQTLRGYDRLGLVVPQRSRGRGRRYSLRDIAKLRHIQHLSQDEGINLEGIRRILDLEAQLDDAQQQVTHLLGLVAERATTPGARLFTAASTGQVHLGRTYRSRTPRALTSGR